MQVVVVPLTVLGNWLDEFKRFAPALKVIPYMGEQAAREQLRTHIVDYINAQPKEQRKTNPKLNFNVFLTSYDLAIKDAEFLQRFDWKYLVVVRIHSFISSLLHLTRAQDEAHRLKNHESILYTTLLSWKAPHKLLLTGTPLQVHLFFLSLQLRQISRRITLRNCGRSCTSLCLRYLTTWTRSRRGLKGSTGTR